MKTSEHIYLKDASSVAGFTGSLQSLAHPKILCCVFMNNNLIFLGCCIVFFLLRSVFLISLRYKNSKELLTNKSCEKHREICIGLSCHYSLKKLT